MITTYDQLAEEYGALANEHGASTRAAMEMLLFPHAPPGSRVLDIGCAAGVAVEVLVLSGGYAAYGIDVSPEMIRVAKRDRICGRFACVDWLYFMTGGWDVIQVFAFLHLFPKAEVPRLMAKLRSELRPGGYLLTGTTIEMVPREGFEGKDDYTGAPPRYRARWTPQEIVDVWTPGWRVAMTATHTTTVRVRKTWWDMLLRRPL